MFSQCASEGLDGFASLESDDCRKCADLESLSKLSSLFGITINGDEIQWLAGRGLGSGVVGELFEYGREDLAWLTPVCIKINENDASFRCGHFFKGVKVGIKVVVEAVRRR